MPLVRRAYILPRRVALFLPVVSLLGALAVPGWGSPRSTNLVAAGADRLAAGDYDDAIKLFDVALKEDPADAEAWFFAGTALNYKGQWGPALNHLRRVRELSDTNPALDLETGRSLVELYEWPAAAQCLERYVKANPQSGQASLLLGRAYAGMGRYVEAQSAFSHAAALDPDLAGAAQAYIAMVKSRLGDRPAMREALRASLSAMIGATSSLGETPSTVVGRTVRTVQGGQAGPAPSPGEVASDRRWWLSLSFGGGYDTDARGANGTFLQGPNPIPGEDSTFGRFQVDTGFRLLACPHDRLIVGDEAFEQAYGRRQLNADLFDNYFYAEYQHDLTRSLQASTRIWDDFTADRGHPYLNQIAGREALDLGVLPGVTFEAAYTYEHNNYLIPFVVTTEMLTGNPNAVDRDAETHTLTAAGYWTPFEQSSLVLLQTLRLGGGYFHTWNFSAGSDFDFQREGVFADLAIPLPLESRVDVFYAFSWDDYTHKSIATPLPHYHRYDEINGLGVRLTRRLGPHWSAYFEFDYAQDSSNVTGYGYVQHVYAIGLTREF